MATTELLFYGAGGHAKVVLEAWVASGGGVAGVFDDISVREMLNHRPVGKYDSKFQPDKSLVVAVGNNRTRKTLVATVKHSFGKVVHPSAVLSTSCQVGSGTMIMAGAIISSSSVLGMHVIVNHKSCVDHDCVIGDYVHLAPGSTICGHVSIGEGTLIGAGATILPRIRIGKWATIGAGSVVAEDVPDFAVSVGVPAKVTKYIEDK